MIKPGVTPFRHQIESVELFINSNYRHAFFYDVGTGKTLTALMCYDYLKSREIVDQLLILAPVSLIENAWGVDIKKFTDFTYNNLNKKCKFNSAISICNLESLISNKKLETIKKWIQQKPTMCVIDESSRIKGFKTKSTKTVLSLRDYFKARIVMSATPAPNDDSELWSQMVFVSDDIFPSNFFAFRHRYFTLTRGGFSMGSTKGLSKAELGGLFKKGFTYKIINSKRDEFYQKVEPYAKWLKKRDVLDLPPEIDVIRSTTLSDDQRKAYKQMKEKLVTEINGKDVVASIALAKMTRLRQITSGFSVSDEGDVVTFKTNPKLNELKCLIEELGDNQALIFAEYHKEIDDIKGVLGDKAGVLDGRTKNRDETIEAFRDKNLQYLIAHPKSGGQGLSFNEVNYCIFYSLSYSFESYFQAKGRIVRAGKQAKATFIHLLMENTIDEKILECVQRKRSQQELIAELLK